MLDSLRGFLFEQSQLFSASSRACAASSRLFCACAKAFSLRWSWSLAFFTVAVALSRRAPRGCFSCFAFAASCRKLCTVASVAPAALAACNVAFRVGFVPAPLPPPALRVGADCGVACGRLCGSWHFLQFALSTLSGGRHNPQNHSSLFCFGCC